MTQVFIVWCLIFVAVSAVLDPISNLRCSDNEYEEACPTDCLAARTTCPKDKNYLKTCENEQKCQQATCLCKFNYSRAENGTCIPTKSCPAFPCTQPNEEHVACPPACPSDSCDQATPDATCPIIGFLLVWECHPACRCKKDFWRLNGVCVPYEQCRT